MSAPTDLRGHMHRANRLMPDDEARAFLRTQKVAHVGNVADKTWFFDRVLDKYGEAEWVFEPGYPHLDRIVLYEQRIEIMTGKHSAGRSH